MTSNKKSVIITGCSKNIGRYLCLHFAKKGYSIIGHYYKSQQEINKLQSEIQDIGTLFFPLKRDLSEICTDFIDKCQILSSNIVGLINNASVFFKGNIDYLEDSKILKLININSINPLLLSKQYYKKIKQGFIINIIDANNVSYSKNYQTYRLSKIWLRSLTKECALNFAPNVRVNSISPGIIMPKDKISKTLSENAPLKTGGNIEDIIKSTDFIINNKSITGMEFYVDGGIHLK